MFMRIKEITETIEDFKSANGQSSPIPGRSVMNTKKKTAKNKVEKIISEIPNTK